MSLLTLSCSLFGSSFFVFAIRSPVPLKDPSLEKVPHNPGTMGGVWPEQRMEIALIAVMASKVRIQTRQVFGQLGLSSVSKGCLHLQFFFFFFFSREGGASIMPWVQVLRPRVVLFGGGEATHREPAGAGQARARVT